MRQRLILLRELLAEEGSLWIQIDDEEQAYLKVVCDEIFGRTNFVNMISVNMKNIAGASGGGEDKRIKKKCEYILVYAKKYILAHSYALVYLHDNNHPKPTFKVSSGRHLISILCLCFHFHLKPGFQLHHDLFIVNCNFLHQPSGDGIAVLC